MKLGAVCVSVSKTGFFLDFQSFERPKLNEEIQLRFMQDGATVLRSGIYLGCGEVYLPLGVLFPNPRTVVVMEVREDGIENMEEVVFGPETIYPAE